MQRFLRLSIAVYLKKFNMVFQSKHFAVKTKQVVSLCDIKWNKMTESDTKILSLIS